MSMRDKIAKAVMGIKAFHSSPHDFDRFDLSKIGTGEGAQVYGHGIYAAENPAVSGQGGQYWEQFLRHPALTEAQQHAGGRLRAEGFDKEKALAATQRDVNDWLEMSQPADAAAQMRGRSTSFADREYAKKMLVLRQAELEALVSGKAGPRTYELNIKADPAQMLDWDKALKLQPRVLENLESNFVLPIKPEMTGQELHRTFADYLTKPRASERMAEAGIPGIKYLDEGSRGRQVSSKNALWQEPLTSNYVVFDPSIIDITKKYAVPGALGAGAMGSAFGQDQYEVAQ